MGLPRPQLATKKGNENTMILEKLISLGLIVIVGKLLALNEQIVA